MPARERASPAARAPLLSRAATAGSRERRPTATARSVSTRGVVWKPLTTDELDRVHLRDVPAEVLLRYE